MKKYNRILAMFLAVLTLVSVISVQASATYLNLQPGNAFDTTGGCSKYATFEATKSGTASIKFSISKGTMMVGAKSLTVYGSYEIKIRDENNKIIYDEDAYCTGSKTVKFKVTKGKKYSVQVYFWQAKTTAVSYYNKGKISENPKDKSIRWYIAPSIAAVDVKNGNLS